MFCEHYFCKGFLLVNFKLFKLCFVTDSKEGVC